MRCETFHKNLYIFKKNLIVYLYIFFQKSYRIKLWNKWHFIIYFIQSLFILFNCFSFIPTKWTQVRWRSIDQSIHFISSFIIFQRSRSSTLFLYVDIDIQIVMQLFFQLWASFPICWNYLWLDSWRVVIVVSKTKKVINFGSPLTSIIILTQSS